MTNKNTGKRGKLKWEKTENEVDGDAKQIVNIFRNA